MVVHGCFVINAAYAKEKPTLVIRMKQQKITALKVQKKNPGRVNVYLDGEFALGLSRIVAGWLSVGQELSEEKIAELKAEDAHEVTYQKTLRFLSYRPRSEKEVIDYLRKKDVPEGAAEKVLARLKEKGHVDDEKFAQLWVANRSEFRPRGRRALLAELRQKGVPNPIIERAVEVLDEEKLARLAAEKQARRYRQLDWVEFRKKMTGFLARRGFNYEIISQTVREMWEQQELSNSDEEFVAEEVTK